MKNLLRKINKLLKNPNMFFYDFFRKRVYKTSPINTQKTIEKVTFQSTLSVDIIEINRIGLAKYISQHLNAGLAPEDGFDKNGLLVWGGYLNGLIYFISNLKEAMSLNITIYTLGGGYSYKTQSDQPLDINLVSKRLSTRPDFIIELSNVIGFMNILHIYLYDINAEGVVIVRSNRAMIRKAPIDELLNTFKLINNNFSEKIDAVYTWVNQADVNWQQKWIDTFPEDNFDPDRFTNNEELKYSLRSLNKYAPWLNKIYIVSNCKKPDWLILSDKVVWVDHSEIFHDSDVLPTFNSHAIECCLHKIVGLSEKFIYLNDDFILSQPCLPSDFFDETGRSISYFESYGMVNPLTKNQNIPDYLIASINSNRLIKSTFPSYEARNLHRHVPYCLKKSVLTEIENIYPDNFSKTRSSKLRSDSDINLTSFLYHHYAFASGHAVKGDLSGIIIRPENIKQLITKDSYKYKVICFNDGNGSSTNNDYKIKTIEYLEKRLSERAPWENTVERLRTEDTM